MVKKGASIAIGVALILSVFVAFGLPYVLSAVTGVPLWYLFPNLIPHSIFTIEGTMSVKVSPMAPTMNNQLVTVTVVDANNNTPIANSLVEINEGSYGILNRTTGFDGTAQFPFIGFTTQISVSKGGYADSDTIVIPQIPADWVTTRNNQDIAMLVTIIGSWGAAGITVYFERKTEAKTPIRRKGK